MRQMLFLGLLALVAIVMPSTSSVAGPRDLAVVAAPQDLYCLQSEVWGYPGKCRFSTYAQCAATAWGPNGQCGPNPFYLYPRQNSHYLFPRQQWGYY